MVNNCFGAFLNDYILNTIHPWGFERFKPFNHVADVVSGKISLCFEGLRVVAGTVGVDRGGREEGAG